MSNLHTHITLRNLRPPGTRARAIPRGFGFNLVSCPNYLFEIFGWAVIAAMTNTLSGTWSFIFADVPCSLACSLHLPRGIQCSNGTLGFEEAPKLQARVWQGIPSQEGHLPLHSVVATSTHCGMVWRPVGLLIYVDVIMLTSSLLKPDLDSSLSPKVFQNEAFDIPELRCSA